MHVLDLDLCAVLMLDLPRTLKACGVATCVCTCSADTILGQNQELGKLKAAGFVSLLLGTVLGVCLVYAVKTF